MICYDKIFVLSTVSLLSIVFVNTIKTDDWPPQVIVDSYVYAMPELRKCQEEYKIDTRTLQEFETSTDLNSLPNDRSFKCFLSCSYYAMGFLVPNNTKLQPAQLLGIIAGMDDIERSGMLHLISGCTKAKSRDLCEAVYQANVCMKKKDNEHYYLTYSEDYWINRYQKSTTQKNNDSRIN